MDEIRLSIPQATLILGAAIGFVLGLVPLIAGIVKKKVGKGVLGLIATTLGGALAGVIISIPAMAVSTWLILREDVVATGDANPEGEADPQEPEEN